MTRRLVALAAVLALAGLVVFYRALVRPYRGYPGSQVLVVEPGMRATGVAVLLVASMWSMAPRRSAVSVSCSSCAPSAEGSHQAV